MLRQNQNSVVVTVIDYNHEKDIPSIVGDTSNPSYLKEFQVSTGLIALRKSRQGLITVGITMAAVAKINYSSTQVWA